MNFTLSNSTALIGLACLLTSSVALATDRPVTMADIENLERQLAELKARFMTQNSELKAAAPMAKSTPQSDPVKPPSEPSTTLKTYATIRPTFGVINQDDASNWDVRDALSHAGIKVTHEFMPGWQAELHGEWGIDLANEGNFGKSRRAYTALGTPYGRFGIGKQRPAQYLFIAEYVDIFNHASSPFAYDPESIFFVDNLVTYRYELGPMTFIAAGQFNGDKGDNQTDLFNTGLSYDNAGLHAAITYQQNDVYDNEQHIGENQLWSGALAYQFTSRFYAAMAYQDKDYQRVEALDSRQGHTFDLSLAYQLAKHYKLKTGYFDFDDGYGSHDPLNQSFDGYNVTLEWLPTPPLRVHLEYLNKSFDNQIDMDSISIGFRYDYKQEWQFD
ncbi:porin [Pseudoalteromonas sp. Of11M-6]|uniref:porin n=1 Tax=Pseudoalteromonas sp. Of11M-6 TaxID=2917754 RepID=UPI001EF5F2D2|nr:porin [Pseudoalteromonas sp. Of11M-6]MCG7553208.1 porin [Pseudoalteromonas sp. Of11M-6]